MSMSDTEINEAIAQVCGWTNIMICPGFACPDQSKFPIGIKDGKSQPIPEYATDLNAMHEAEMRLLELCKATPNLICDYADTHLMDVTKTQVICFLLVAATARQRAEAFLRTLNLWKD